MSIELTLVLSVLWGAVAVPLAWLNPLNYKQDEVAAKVLVYTVAPFIFFSVVFFVIGAVKSMSRRQERKQLESRLYDVQEKAQALYDKDNSQVRALFNKARIALLRGDHEGARRRMGEIEGMFNPSYAEFNPGVKRVSYASRITSEGGIRGMI